MKPMKVLSIMLLLLLVASSLPAVAGVVNMQFNGTGSNSYGGVPTYPYAITVNGNPDSLMCISYNEHIQGGETWQADVMSLDAFALSSGLGYQTAGELAWLFLQAASDGGANPGYNAVAWNLVEGVPVLDAGALAIFNTVASMTFNQGEFPGIRVYVPIDGTQSWVGEPVQVFLGTPEPSTLLTLGSGILGLAGLARKRLFS